MRFMDTSEGGTDAFGKFVSGEQACWLDHAPFPMHPVRFDGVQPWTFDGQPTAHDADTPVTLHALVMVCNPGPHLTAHMPRGIVPNQQPGGRAACGQPFADLTCSR